MAHKARAAVLHCIDFRFVEPTWRFLQDKGYRQEYDDIAIAGSVKNLVDPYDETDPDFVYRQIAVAKKLHDVKEVILINHTDCGAYGGRANFTTDDEEHDRHVKDLRIAKEMIEEHFADDKLTVLPFLAVLQDDNTVLFEEVGPEVI